MAWEIERYELAFQDGVQPVMGVTYRGLGLHDPHGGRGEWHLTHIGSGLQVGVIKGKKAHAIKVATEIAEAGDWSFTATNFSNCFPDLAKVIPPILDRHGIKRRNGELPEYGREIVREIAAKQ